MNQELYQVADSLYALYICVVSRPMVGGGEIWSSVFTHNVLGGMLNLLLLILVKN